MLSIHYHLKCQDITDNWSDNKLSMIQSIQMVVFAIEMGYLDDKGLDFMHGFLSLDSQMVNIHYHQKCQDNADSAGDNKVSLIQYIKIIVLQLKWVILMTAN